MLVPTARMYQAPEVYGDLALSYSGRPRYMEGHDTFGRTVVLYVKQ